MTMPPGKLTAVTLGVRDLQASARFYEAIGFRRKFRATGDEIVFLDGGGVVLALWDWDKLAQDAVLPGRTQPQSFRGATFAWNCAAPAEVDAIFAKAIRPARAFCASRKRQITAGIADIFPIRTDTPGKSCRRPDLPSPRTDV
jgi:uncharacterized protein